MATKKKGKRPTKRPRHVKIHIDDNPPGFFVNDDRVPDWVNNALFATRADAKAAVRCAQQCATVVRLLTEAGDPWDLHRDLILADSAFAAVATAARKARNRTRAK